MSEFVWHDTNISKHTQAVAQERPVAGMAASGSAYDRIYRIAKIFLVVVTLGLATILAAIFVFLPATEIRSIGISGAISLTDAEILAWGNIPAKASWFSVDTGVLAQSLQRNPRLAQVTVSRHFPATLSIVVEERQPLAVVHAYDSRGRLKAHCVDAQGVVFAPYDPAMSAEILPVLSGLEIRGLQYGMSLGSRFNGLLASLDNLRRTQPALLQAISELRIVDLNDAGLEMLLYPVHYPVPVRLKPVLSPDLIKSILLVLDVVDGRGLIPTIQELDFRTDTYVYRIKEAVSG